MEALHSGLPTDNFKWKRPIPKLIERYRYPWRGGNRFRLYIDGEEFFPAMLDAIGRARRYILLEMYLFESGTVAKRFMEALIEARQRGTSVHLLLDDFGAGGLSRPDRRRLQEAGIELTIYNPLRYGVLRPNLFRDHRKLLLVDGEIAFVGGAGITDGFAPPQHPDRAWHDTMTLIEGPCVNDWFEVFRNNREHWKAEPLGLPAPDSRPIPDGQPGRVIINSPGRMEIKRALLKRLHQATRQIWIATAYFIPSRKVLRQLRRAADRGVDIRLLLPGPHTDLPPVRYASRRFYGRLLRHGIRIYEYQPRFLHAKVLLCDDWAAVGSSNLDRWNLRWNLEANQEIADPEFRDSVETFFREGFGQAREFRKAEWFARPWHRRVLEQFWGWIDILMARRAQRKRHQDRGPGAP